MLVRDRRLLNAHLCCLGNLELENVLEKLLLGPINIKRPQDAVKTAQWTSGLVRPLIATAQQYNTAVQYYTAYASEMPTLMVGVCTSVADLVDTAAISTEYEEKPQ